MSDTVFWTDQLAQKVLELRGNKKEYVVASRITPSGTIHIGNFREPMTAHLLLCALKKMGRQVVHYHSWDDYDRFRKVPANVPEEWEQYIGMPVSKVPDPWECHKSYAAHFEEPFEADMNKVGVVPKIIRESERYETGVYTEDIKFALSQRTVLRGIFDNHRSEPLPEEWFPLQVYCEKCNRDFTKVSNYDEEYTIDYTCKCGHSDTINFKEKHIVKLPWRVDWPMRWHHDSVDFEAAGKEHMTKGGSRSTGNEIMRAVWKEEPPVEKKYEFIGLKGTGGKMSGSKGNVLSLGEVLEVYQPAVLRYLFAGSRPETEFSISFDLDVLQVYEYFDQVERLYYGTEESQNQKEIHNKKRIYELSNPEKPGKQPYQAAYRHLTTILQMVENDEAGLLKYYDKELSSDYDKKHLLERAHVAWNWIQNYSPEDFRFSVQKELVASLSDQEKKAMRDLHLLLTQQIWKEDDLAQELYELAKKHDLSSKEFFAASYKVLLNKEKGPRLAGFLLLLGERATNLLKQV